jgi:hypothetical protein
MNLLLITCGCDVDSSTTDGFALTTPGKISIPRFVERSHQ